MFVKISTGPNATTHYVIIVKSKGVTNYRILFGGVKSLRTFI